jgi:hypothetical protein
MSREEFPRIHQLREKCPNFASEIDEHPVKKKHFMHIEADLQKLQPNDWQHLKQKTINLCNKMDAKRGWQYVFDSLNEAKAYVYLVDYIHCTCVEFIPKSTKVTPDLRGRVGNSTVLCEVKTINCSDKEAIARRKRDVRLVAHIIREGLFTKLKNTINSAEKQLRSYKQEVHSRENTLNIIYIVLNFEESLNEYIDQHTNEINDRVDELLIPEIEILFDVKPPFYSATCESPASCRYVLRDGRTLTKLEDE